MIGGKHFGIRTIRAPSDAGGLPVLVETAQDDESVGPPLNNSDDLVTLNLVVPETYTAYTLRLDTRLLIQETAGDGVAKHIGASYFVDGTFVRGPAMTIVEPFAQQTLSSPAFLFNQSTVGARTIVVRPNGGDSTTRAGVRKMQAFVVATVIPS